MLSALQPSCVVKCLGVGFVVFEFFSLIVFIDHKINGNVSLFLSGWVLERVMERGVLQDQFSPVDQSTFRFSVSFFYSLTVLFVGSSGFQFMLNDL